MSLLKKRRNPLAIAVPIWQSDLGVSEKIAIDQLLRTVGDTPVFIITHWAVDVRQVMGQFKYPSSNVRRINFPAFYFASTHTYNALMKSAAFYNPFVDYEFVLIYQLDCLLFKLPNVQDTYRPYSFIGAPLFKEHDNASSASNLSVGMNGGFSLRKVCHQQRTISLLSFFLDTQTWVKSISRSSTSKSSTTAWLLATICDACRMSLHWPALKNIWELSRDNSLNEDVFWSNHVAETMFWYQVPRELHVMMRFAFETRPAFLYELNNQQLPVGCHGWLRYEPEFWRPIVRRLGHSI